MNIDRSEIYESFAAAFQCLEIEALSRVLADHGITDSAIRQKICGDFIAASAAMLDRGWIREDGAVVHPVLCFAKGSAPLGAITAPASLLLPSQEFSFEEYVGGNLYHFFEEKRENLSDLERGFV